MATATTTATVILGGIVAASVIANVYLYQKSVSLEDAVARLQTTNKELSDSLASVRGSQTPEIGRGSRPLNTTGEIPLSTSQPPGRDENSNYNSGLTSNSITAVAVKAVPVIDGFFESVRYQGTVMDITVDIRSGGNGLVLVDTEIPTGVDFQTSARTAVKVAQKAAGADLSSKDVVFSIRSKGNSTSSDLQAVDGSSAGAAMTALLIIELQGGPMASNRIKQDVVMTRTINSDGTVGPVGGIPEKAIAAGEYGAKVFLVPADQAFYTEQVCQKRQEGPIIYQTCQSQQRPLSEYTEKNYGMKVIEVKDIDEALTHILSSRQQSVS